MKKILLASVLALAPGLVFAQVQQAPRADLGNNLFNIIPLFQGILNMAVPILIALAVVVFLWGVLKYVIAKEETQKKEGKNIMIWGIVGIFVMVSVWGLVAMLQNTFGIRGQAPQAPSVPQSQGENNR
jgi:hypothetical protein